MENLNAEQVKEDIYNCIEGECELCSYYDQTACKEHLMHNALVLIDSQEQRIKELAKKIFAEIETSLMVSGCRAGSFFYEIRVEDYNHYKKKYIGKDINITANLQDGFEKLVHCSECKHGQQVGDLGVACEYGCEEYRPFDHFCAWGERRDFSLVAEDE